MNISFFRGATVVVSLICAGCVSSEQRTAQSMADSVVVDSIARARQDSVNRAQPGYIIDSILPPEEELRRFREAFPGERPQAFQSGSPTREALVRRFLRALAANDTADLRAMAVHAREFSDLYYPDSPYSHPPYRQPLSFAWRRIQQPSDAGFTRLLRRLGGTPLRFVSEMCDPKVLHEGRTTRYAGCLVRVVSGVADTATRRYYGSIVERDGHFKFLSYTNDF
ncbi:MAG: hypothetical protein V4550_03350 [Gemmatimonadota bacterium]